MYTKGTNLEKDWSAAHLHALCSDLLTLPVSIGMPPRTYITVGVISRVWSRVQEVRVQIIRREGENRHGFFAEISSTMRQQSRDPETFQIGCC